MTLGDVQGFVDAIAGLAPASRARKISAVKSLLSFAHRAGYVVFNVGAPVRLPAVKVTLAVRILAEAEMLRLIHTEGNPSNAALLRLGYAAGLRISELVGLRWRDLAWGRCCRRRHGAPWSGCAAMPGRMRRCSAAPRADRSDARRPTASSRPPPPAPVCRPT